MVPERERMRERKRNGDRDRGRKLKWSQWCGIVVAWLSGAACDWFADRVLPLSLPPSSLRVYSLSSVFLSRTHPAQHPVPTFSSPPQAPRFAVARGCPQSSRWADVFDSRARKSFAEVCYRERRVGRVAARERLSARLTHLLAKESLPLFNAEV